ncbi:MAG TPA: hypothetical protein VF773_19980 [Verrucomicrobiae bacterium]
MSLRSLVVVSLRIIALKFLLNIFLTVVPQLVLLEHSTQSMPLTNPFSITFIVVLAALITGACMLWSLALPLAQRITRGLPPDISFGALARVDCYTIAFLAIGLWLTAVHFPHVLNWSHYLFRLAATGPTPGEEAISQVNKYEIFSSVLPFIIGILLFLNGRKWSHKLARRDEHIERTEAAKVPELSP